MGTLSWSAGQSTRDHSSSLIRTELTHKPANMSDFWLQKMRTYFDRIDFDKDGAITRKDFEGMAERFSEKLDATKAADLKTTITNVWDKYLQGVGGGEATQKEPFINAMKSLVKDPSNPSMKATVEGPLPLFFAAVDADGDGMISQEEYATFFQILGLAPEMAPATFQAIDTNNDGLLSKEEFVEAGSEFFLSEDPAKPTKLFWGPLIK